jgi:hypothetical protein
LPHPSCRVPQRDNVAEKWNTYNGNRTGHDGAYLCTQHLVKAGGS